MDKIEFPLRYRQYRPKDSSKIKEFLIPVVDLVVVSNHNVGVPIKCLVDTGANVNIFPTEYAIAVLRFSEKTIKKGEKLEVFGIAGMESVAYGHTCTLHLLQTRIKNIKVYFMKNQPYPLLGQMGFIDRFEKITINVGKKKLELYLNQNK